MFTTFFSGHHSRLHRTHCARHGIGRADRARTPVARPKCSACAGMWSTSPRPTDAGRRATQQRNKPKSGMRHRTASHLPLPSRCLTHLRHGERGALQILTARGVADEQFEFAGLDDAVGVRVHDRAVRHRGSRR